MNRTRPESHSMYYLAIVCPNEIDARVFEFKEWMRKQFGCMVALKSPGHITLIPPFWMDENREQELKETLHQFQSTNHPDVQLNGFSHFDDRVLFIKVSSNHQLTQLKEDTEQHFLQDFSGVIRKDERTFHPHVTIANRDMKPSVFIKAWERFSKEEFECDFTTDKISILKLISGKWNLIDEKYF